MSNSRSPTPNPQSPSPGPRPAIPSPQSPIPNALSLALILLLSICLASWSAAQSKVELRLSVHKGETHQISSTLDQTVRQTINGVAQEMKQKIGIGYTFTVSEIDANGVASARIRFNSVSFHAKTPAGPVDYDSDHPPSQVPAMAMGVAAMLGQGFALKVTSDGRVTEVSGLDNMFNAVIAKMNLPEGPSRAAIERTLRQQLDPENMKSNLQSVFAPFPDHSVAVGETWTRDVRISIGFPMNVQTTYALKGRENGTANIEIEGKAATAPNASIDLGQLQMEYHLEGMQSGSLQIIESTGWTRRAQLSQKLAGSATLQAPGAPPQNVPIVVQSDLKTETRD